MRNRNLPVVILTVLLTSSVATLQTPVARADICSGPPIAFNCHPWAPYGSLTSELRFQFYPYPQAESTAFLNGELDLPDIPISTCPAPPVGGVACFPPNLDFTTSFPPEPQYAFYGIQFNLQNRTAGVQNTWASWGCNFQHGNSQCGIEIRQAIAHLIDRDQFVNNYIAQQAVPIADPVSPAQDPPGSPLATQCSWDTLSSGGDCIDSFNLASDPSGFATPGSRDFCVAVAHLVNSGIGLTNNQNNCAIDPDSPGLTRISSAPIRFFGRATDPRRSRLLNGLLDAINQLFGTRAAIPCFGTITACSPFRNPYGWDMYTFGFQVTDPFADHLDSLFDSSQATNGQVSQCGGPIQSVGDNYAFVCIPSFDTAARAALGTSDSTIFRADTLAALDELGKTAALLPIFTPASTSIALNDMLGLVDQKGAGFSNFWSGFNGHANNGSTPQNPIYTFGGGTDTLRWGQSSEVSSLNPYLAQTVTEIAVLGQVYDTLFRASPAEPTKIQCWMCDNYQESVDASGNTHFLVQLRQNLRWQDGPIVDSKDVKFSLLTIRDLSYNFYDPLLLTVNILSGTTLDIVMQGHSISHLPNLAGSPVIPRHIWEKQGDTTYGDVGTVDPAKLDYEYDPITSGTFIGSGPYVCKSVFPADTGKVGTGCSADQDGNRAGQFDPSTITLQRYDMTGLQGNTDPFLQYMRSYNPAWSTTTSSSTFSGQFQEFSWADMFDNATVTIRDLTQVAACLGASAPTAACPTNDIQGPVFSYWLKPNLHGGTNTISSEVAVVAAHLDDTWVYPFSWNGVQGQQPGQRLDRIVVFSG